MALTNERKLLLLGLLRRNDMHGYLLNAHLDSSIPISLKKPTAYNLLERMEKDGWVEHRDEPTGDRPRRVFSMTKKGEQAFQDMLHEQLKAFAAAEFPAAVSLSFLDAIPASEAIELLRQRRQAVGQYREQMFPREEEGATAESRHEGSVSIALEYTRRFTDLDIRILDEVIGRLEST